MINGKSVCLFIIDPQFDFCHPSGKLYVPGADQDMIRLAAFIDKYSIELDDIQITLDSHHRYHIAHPLAWIDKYGNHPDTSDVTKLTLIPIEDVEAEYDSKGNLISGNPKWKATVPACRQRYVNYVKTLKDNGRYMLIIWPEHCLIGSKGACIQEPLMQSLYNWESQVATVGKVTKGSNPHTEHYSAVRADVEDPKDKSTGLNTDLLDTLKAFDIILGAGEALSHCWLNTFNDIITNFGDEQIKKIICLDDTTSNVPGFEKIGFDFLDEMVAKGMGRTQTTKVFN